MVEILFHFLLHSFSLWFLTLKLAFSEHDIYLCQLIFIEIKGEGSIAIACCETGWTGRGPVRV